MRTSECAIVFGLVLIVAGCGGTDRACVPGQAVACVGTGGCAGGQSCNAEGSGYEACHCAAGDDAGVDAGADADLDSGSPPADGSASACTTAADLLNPDACGGGEACTVLDGAGALGCLAPGTTGLFESCSSQGSCQAGLGCFGWSQSDLRCVPYCASGSDGPCPQGSSCGATFTTAAGTIGLCMPTAACDIVTGTGCDAPAGCYVGDAAGHAVCATAGSTPEGQSCTVSNNCLPGSVCSGQGTKLCHPLCHGDNDCTEPTTCKGVGLVFSAAPTVGICLP